MCGPWYNELVDTDPLKLRDIAAEVAWLVAESDGVKGLRPTGSVMEWGDVLSRYMPSLKKATGAKPE